MISLTQRSTTGSSQIRFELFLWAVVPAVFLAFWMYLFPTRETARGIFNSWGSLAVPLTFFAVAVYFRLHAERRFRVFVLLPITIGSIVLWVLFAAFIKSIAFKLYWIWDKGYKLQGWI